MFEEGFERTPVYVWNIDNHRRPFNRFNIKLDNTADKRCAVDGARMKQKLGTELVLV